MIHSPIPSWPARLQLRVRAVGVPTASRLEAVDEGVELGEVIGTELDAGRARVLLDPGNGGGTGDGDDSGLVVAATDAGDPGNGQLGGRDLLAGGNGLDLLDQLQVVRKLLVLEAREASQATQVRGVGLRLDLASEDLSGILATIDRASEQSRRIKCNASEARTSKNLHHGQWASRQ